MTRVLVFGATGMLGSALFARFSRSLGLEAWGTIRAESGKQFFRGAVQQRLIAGIDVLEDDDLARAIDAARPDFVINCVGLVKQLQAANDPLAVLPVNSMLPHRLARLVTSAGARLIHISTDCVFSGRKGNYRESDPSDADDLYGKSKYIGEVVDRPDAVTLRTSIIGHELHSTHGLIDWFLAATGDVKGYERAIFSGLPTVELARVIELHVIPNPGLSGLYHVSAKPISKLALLRLVSDVYGKKVRLVPDTSVVVDRSLNSELFRGATGYVAPEWPALVEAMHESSTP